MLYKRNPQRQRRYGYQNPAANQSAYTTTQKAEVEAIKTIEDIPLPNELESPSDFSPEYRSPGIPSIINFFKERIHLEEIILIGVIFLLLDEGINGLEDEFLLIMLVFVLIT